MTSSGTLSDIFELSHFEVAVPAPQTDSEFIQRWLDTNATGELTYHVHAPPQGDVTPQAMTTSSAPRLCNRVSMHWTEDDSGKQCEVLMNAFGKRHAIILEFQLRSGARDLFWNRFRRLVEQAGATGKLASSAVATTQPFLKDIIGGDPAGMLERLQSNYFQEEGYDVQHEADYVCGMIQCLEESVLPTIVCRGQVLPSWRRLTASLNRSLSMSQHIRLFQFWHKVLRLFLQATQSPSNLWNANYSKRALNILKCALKKDPALHISLKFYYYYASADRAPYFCAQRKQLERVHLRFLTLLYQ